MSPELVAELSALGEKTVDEVAGEMPRGWRHCETTCPLALWLDEGTGEVWVGGGLAEINGEQIDLPDSVAEFVCAFDNGAYPELCNERFYEQLEQEAGDQ